MGDAFPYPYTLEDVRWWMGHNANDTSTHFAIEAAAELAGGIGYVLSAAEKRGTANIGYWLGRGYWGRGIATAACNALTSELLAMNGILRVETIVYAPNVASARVLEKCGFVREGVMRKAIVKRDDVYDAYLYAKVREE
jgi:ribosomal-protein-alanine N-acetyltransferase